MTPQLKRKFEEDLDPVEGVTVSFIDGLLSKVPGRTPVEVMLELVQNQRLSLKDFSELIDKPPSFAKANWKNVAPIFELNPSYNRYQFKKFSTPHSHLPPSFHKQVIKEAIKWLDVYQEKGAQERESACVRLMDAWHVPLVALFKGRVIDMPKSSMPGTFETSGGEVEHEVYMLEGILLLVMELKLAIKSERDHIAQVMLELASAYKLNSDKEFNPQLPVFAVLTDLVSFNTRAHFFSGMGKVTERIFSILLQAYISILDVVVKRSTQRGAGGDMSKHSSSTAGKPTQAHSRIPGKVRYSLDKWTQAVGRAREAQKILVECDCSSLQVWETAGQHGLRLLEESVSYLSKIGSLENWDQQQIESEIQKIVAGMCEPHVQAVSGHVNEQ